MAPKSERINVVWFKCTDLRTHDHEALIAAHAEGLPVLHLFVLDPRWYRRKTAVAGFPRTGALRAKFQLEAIQDLRKRLEERGHFLTVRESISTASTFEELCADFEVSNVFAFREVCPEELRVEAVVRRVLARKGSNLRAFWGFELYHGDDLSFDPERRGHHTYSSFRRVVEERSQVRRTLPSVNFQKCKPVFWKNFAHSVLPSVAELIGTEAYASTVVSKQDAAPAEMAWIGGETAGLDRVDEYLFRSESLGLDYVGATMTTDPAKSVMRDRALTKFSPWLAHGCISARYLYWEVKRYERERRKNKSTYWIIHELIWRDFVRFGSLHAGSKIFKIGGLENKLPKWEWSHDRKLLDAWVTGKTGFPFIDVFMRELRATGYCNHMGRETAGWFLICDLGIDWRMGAEWFETILLDFEPAANYFNWVYRCLPAMEKQKSPGTHLQTLEALHWGAQHDPDANYIKRWIPELVSLPGTLAREPWRLGLPKGPKTGTRPAVASEALETLVAMGFPEAVAAEALAISGSSDVDAAVALLVADEALGAQTTPTDSKTCGQCKKTSSQGSIGGDGIWYCSNCWQAWGHEPESDDNDLAEAIELSLSQHSSSKSINPSAVSSPKSLHVAEVAPGATDSFEYGVDYPLPILPPVSLTSTQKIEDNARKEQAARDRQTAEARRRLGLMAETAKTQLSSHAIRKAPSDQFDKNRWEDQRRSRGAAVRGGATERHHTCSQGGYSAGGASAGLQSDILDLNSPQKTPPTSPAKKSVASEDASFVAEGRIEPDSPFRKRRWAAKAV